MALQLTGEEFEMIRDDFLAIDQDGDGFINREEILVIFEGKKEEHVDFMMKFMDVDCSGTIEFHEFLEIMAFLSYNKGLSQSTAKQMLRALDKDNSGFLSADEIKLFYEIISDMDEDVPSAAEIEDLIQNLDSNGDGKIDFEEFLNGIDLVISS